MLSYLKRPEWSLSASHNTCRRSKQQHTDTPIARLSPIFGQLVCHECRHRTSSSSGLIMTEQQSDHRCCHSSRCCKRHRLSPSLTPSLFLIVSLLLLSDISSRFVVVQGSTLAERELARKLIKLFLAAAVLSPPGLGAFPLPIPFPVPFGIETLKPPIYAPFGFPFL